jgi:histidine ammonia-lyase
MINIPATYELISLDFFNEVLFKNASVQIGEESEARVNKSFSFLKEFSKNKLIYGINTGFGPMAQYRIDEADLVKLQYNLIRSHCSGTGQKIPDLYVKSALLCRLIGLLQGYSGIDTSVVVLLKEMINKNICPVIFEHGGVGASGDLVQLAHIALALIGEGTVSLDGIIMSSSDALAQNGLKPIDIKIREGLSLINGTSVMTGIGIVNLIYAKNLFDWALVSSAILNELVDSYDDSFSSVVNSLKNHEGQEYVASMMRSFLKGSRMIKKRHQSLYNKKIEDKQLKEKVQEYYSLRCVPQVLGPVFSTLKGVEQVLLEEACSVNDNPVVDYENQDVLHGGNFHGDYISLEMDKLKIVITKMTMLMERQLNFLMNSKLNQKFPPFVNLGVLGLNLGMQGVQFTATSTTAESQTLSFPNYLHSIPNNNDNQDIVSMGTNSALFAKKVIENASEVISIHLMAIIQAIDFIHNQELLSPNTSLIYKELRRLVPVFVEDSPKYLEINLIKDYILNNKPGYKL